MNAAEPIGFDVVVVVNILSDVERRVEAIVAVDFSETKRPFFSQNADLGLVATWSGTIRVSGIALCKKIATHNQTFAVVSEIHQP